MNLTIIVHYKNWLECLFQTIYKFLFVILLIFSCQVKAQDVNSNNPQLEKILLLKNDSAKVDSLLVYYKKLGSNDDLKTAVKNFEKAISIANRAGNKIAIAELHTIIGNLHKNHGEFDDAMVHQNKALEIALALNSKKNLALIYTYIGVIYKEQSDFITATSFQLKALKYFEELKDSSGISKTMLNLGVLCKNQGKFVEAIDYYKKVESIYLKMNKPDGVAAALGNMAVAYSELGKNDSAYLAIIQTIEIDRKANRKKNYLSNMTTLGNILSRLGKEAEIMNDTIKADTCYSRAEKYFFLGIESDNDYFKGMNSINLATIFTYRKRYAEARGWLNKGLELFQKLESKKYLPNVYSRFSMLDSTMATDPSFPLNTRLEHSFQALHYFTLYNQAQNELINEESNKKTTELKVRYETEKKDNEILLLNKENAFKDISLKEQLSALLISKLRDEKNKNEIELLSSSNAISELRLTSTQQELEKQRLKSKAEAYELQLSKQERDLKNIELGEEKLLRGVTTGGSLALLLIGLLVFNRFKLRKQLEQKEAILRQRKAISADLHDDVGSTLSSISIYSEAIKNKLTHNETDKVMDLVNKIGENARETISNLSDIVWSINPINDSGEVIFNRMETFAYSLFSSKGIKLNFTSDKSLHSINYSIEMKQNMFLIFKEAINNCAKYSQATLVNVDIRKNNNLMNITISDNGIGFDPTSTNGGNGLRNMKERASELSGTLDIQSMNKGTKISLSLPLAS
ncbi:MAG: tetratricopeptide repeat protein [Bacteroidia bacterium]|jgi:two-component system sensor histidine kinase UhpB|nr:tetratricopeptide repeat protein [Bacteroidia bacterium]